MRILEAVEHWLPPPSIMRMNGLGVDISESSIKYIGFKPSYYSGQSLHVNKWGDIPLPEGVISRGEVKNIEGLATALKNVVKQTGERYVRLSLPEERVYFFETEIDTNANNEELRSQLEFKLEENVPLPTRDSYFDYQIFPDEQSVSGMSAVVAVVPRAIVDSYHEACRGAGMIPLSFEVELQAIARSVIAEGDQATRLLVDFGKSRTGIGIVHRGLLLYTSTLEVGGNDLSSALRKVVGNKEEDEYTKIKIEQGLAGGADNKASAEALLGMASAIKDEIMMRLQYWHDKDIAAKRPIEQIILCGGSSNLRGLPTYFAETLGIDTVLADVWQRALSAKNDVPEIDKRHSLGYATAIGLGLTSFL